MLMMLMMSSINGLYSFLRQCYRHHCTKIMFQIVHTQLSTQSGTLCWAIITVTSPVQHALPPPPPLPTVLSVQC